MRVEFLDLARDDGTHADVRTAVLRVLDAGHYVLGRELEAFEAEWAAACGTTHAVGVGSGLDALALCLRAAGVGPGDEVLVPSNTFIATWLAVDAVGARPVPVEPDLDTGLVEARAFLGARTAATKAVVPVHLGGSCADVQPLLDSGLIVVEDAAQAHGASRAGRPAGGLGHAAAFSFYPAKNLGALGDGGAVTTSDPELAARVRLFRNYGSAVKYEHEVRGGNSRLDELQAAALRAKLPHLPRLNAARRAIAARYADELSGLDRLTVTAVGPGDVAYTVTLRHPDRDRLRERLGAAGVATQVFYPVPPHRSGAYADRGWPALPIADELARTTLALPVGPYLTDEEVSFVITAVRRAVEELATSRPVPAMA